MATIAAGASDSVTLPQGSTLKTTGTGTAVLGPGPQANTQYGLRGTNAIGPFNWDQVINISATTQMAYTVAANSKSLPVARVVTDSFGNPTGLIDSNSGSPIGLSGSSGPIQAKSSLAVMGDSIFAYGAQALPTNYGVFTGGGIFSNSSIGWCNELLAVDGVPFDITGFYAVGGTSLSTQIATQLPQVLADPAESVWMHGGVNNFNTGIENDTIAAILTKFRTIITALAGTKKLVIIDSINPVLQSGSTNSRQRAGQFQAANAGIQKICAEFSNVIYNDTYSALVDTTSTALNPVANAVRTDDGIHFLSTGARLAGYASFKNIASKIKLTKYKTEGANLLSNFAGTGGTVTGGSGSITGTPPVGYNCQVASGSAAVAISTLAPDMIRLSITNAGGSASTVYVQATATVAAAILAQLSQGDTIQAGFGYQCSGNVLLNRLAVTVRFNGQTSINGMGQDTSNEPTITYPQNAGSGVRQTPPIPLASTPTQVEFIIAINVGATTGAAVIDLYNPTFKKLT